MEDGQRVISAPEYERLLRYQDQKCDTMRPGGCTVLGRETMGPPAQMHADGHDDRPGCGNRSRLPQRAFEQGTLRAGVEADAPGDGHHDAVVRGRLPGRGSHGTCC